MRSNTTHIGRGRPELLLLAVIACVSAACDESLPPLAEPAGCRHTVFAGGPVRSDSAEAPWRAVDWRLPPDTAQAAELEAWCAAVGPAMVAGWADAAAASPELDTLRIVSWNVAVGGGDLAGLVGHLRAGLLTDGRPVDHFVLLLQEAHRRGTTLPPHDPDLPGGSPKDTGPPDGERSDIVRAAEALGLWLVYVPSMRNGPAEDRGNAILSTLRPVEPVAVELPVARQRRVAVAASFEGRTRDGRPWRIQAATVHLESSPSGSGSDEAQRLRQARALVSLLPNAPAAVTAGDFNTKSGGVDEPLVPVMLGAYPSTPRLPDGHTYARFFGIWRQYLDYMFFRLPPGAGASYTRGPDRYGSDHHPLVGQVVF